MKRENWSSFDILNFIMECIIIIITVYNITTYGASKLDRGALLFCVLHILYKILKQIGRKKRNKGTTLLSPQNE